MSVAPAKVVPIKADKTTLRFHYDTFVFDALSIAYVLDEKYTERCLAGGVNGTNVTFALEEDWDQALRSIESYLAKIDRSPLLTLSTTADDLLAAKASGKLGVVFGTQG